MTEIETQRGSLYEATVLRGLGTTVYTGTFRLEGRGREEPGHGLEAGRP